MALTASYTREPTTGGDNNAWASYLLPQNRRGGEGALSCRLYNSGGSLYLSTGFFGINDGVTRGTVEVTTEGTISLAGLTAGYWAKIEAAVSGTSVTFTTTTIAGGNDFTVIPTDFSNAWVGVKGGFYISSNKRCLGICWINSSGTLQEVITCKPYIKDWFGRNYYIISAGSKILEVAVTSTSTPATNSQEFYLKVPAVFAGKNVPTQTGNRSAFCYTKLFLSANSTWVEIDSLSVSTAPISTLYNYGKSALAPGRYKLESSLTNFSGTTGDVTSTASLWLFGAYGLSVFNADDILQLI